jgi:hypothetical protein
MDYSSSTDLTDAQAAGLAAMMGVYWLVMMVLAVVLLIAMWKIFTKAGKPGWAAIVPIYNIIVLLEVVGRPVWWIVLLLVPFVNIVIGFMLSFDLAKSFGKGAGYALGLIVLPYLFYPMLAFGSSTYVGPAAAVATPAPYYPPQQAPPGYPPQQPPVAYPPQQPPQPTYAPPQPPQPPVYNPPQQPPPAYNPPPPPPGPPTG